MLFATHVNVSSFAQHIQGQPRKDCKTNSYFPHVNSNKKGPPTGGPVMNHPQCLVLGVNINVFSFFDKGHADYKSHRRDDDRVPKPAVDITLRGDDGE